MVFRYACGTRATAARPAAHTFFAVGVATTAKIQTRTCVVSSSVAIFDDRAFLCHQGKEQLLQH